LQHRMLALTFALALQSLGACEGREQLGTELANATMSPVLWDPPDSTSVIDPNAPPPTACAMRLRDLRTGTEYQIMRRQATRTNPDAPSGTPATWEQHGDYMRMLAEPGAGPPSSLVRIACGSWKVMGLVPNRSP
jgi:hypothetical protein